MKKVPNKGTQTGEKDILNNSVIFIARRQSKTIKKPGNYLLSLRQAQVPSALERFTYVFGMGTCISTLLWSPGYS